MRHNTFHLATGVVAIGCLGSLAVAALLGVIPEHPQVTFNIEPDSGMGTTYDASGELFSARSNAIALQIAVGQAPNLISQTDGTPSLILDVFVNGSGILVEGHPGDDLIIKGTVTIDGTTYSGNLLTGEGVAFGYLDSGGTTDTFDFRFTTTGGSLANTGGPFHGKDIGLVLTVENSSFVGTFGSGFGGDAKGILGAIDPPVGGGPSGGCTPGFWKQPHHDCHWPAPYGPDDLFAVVFNTNCAAIPGNPTLGEALRLNGGKVNALVRHAAAALLNAAHPDYDPHPMFDTPQKVIDAFNAACGGTNVEIEDTKNLLEASNEIGCPIGGNCN